ncbi:MAG: protoporphyrinogen oxidase HemJ [Shimia sp.]
MGDLLGVAYPWIKVGHIVSVISWMAAMFYLPRLFVYHAEAVARGSETDALFQTMERKLNAVIMTPAMLATWGFGILLAATPGVLDWGAPWVWIKLAAVLAMTATHGWLAKQRKAFASGGAVLEGRSYRIANEVPTILMFVIVIAVIVRPF